MYHISATITRAVSEALILLRQTTAATPLCTWQARHHADFIAQAITVIPHVAILAATRSFLDIARLLVRKGAPAWATDKVTSLRRFNHPSTPCSPSNCRLSSLSSLGRPNSTPTRFRSRRCRFPRILAPATRCARRRARRVRLPHVTTTFRFSSASFAGMR